MLILDSYQKIFGNKNRILVVMPHPDDCDLYCGATVARLTQDGKRVRIVKMTYGDRGSKSEKISRRQLREVREKEDRKAMSVLGVRNEDNIYLGIGDGEIEHDLATIGKVVYQIREFKPEIIITTNPQDYIVRFDKDINWVNHRDHRHTGRIALDAAYPYSRDTLFFPEQLENNHLSSHICTEFLFTDYYSHPDLVYIDVTDFIEYRTKALASHSSQYSLDHAKESTDFFTKLPQYGEKRYDRFRYVVAD
ncbi:PIG-L family deacetylase [Patescibacteria group bacterium]|nr:PIG-L family deacetylase [Patescibacteria group bacterium]